MTKLFDVNVIFIGQYGIRTSPLFFIPPRNFGDSGATVLTGGVACLNVQHAPATANRVLRCTLPSGSGIDLAVLIIQARGPNSLQGSNETLPTVRYVQCLAGQFQQKGEISCGNCPSG